MRFTDTESILAWINSLPLAKHRGAASCGDRCLVTGAVPSRQDDASRNRTAQIASDRPRSSASRFSTFAVSLVDSQKLDLPSAISRRAGKSGVSLSATARECWQDIVNQVRPDVIVFDSLSQLHDCDENSNIDMRHVLHELAILSSYEAPEERQRPTKIIIHHTHKPSRDRFYGASSATSIRGASSICRWPHGSGGTTG